VSGISAVVIVFNQPMEKLNTKNKPKLPVSISPPLQGDWRWISSDTLKMELKQRPHYATTYTVRILSGTCSLARKCLDKKHVWKFKTPRPKLIHSELAPSNRYHPNVIEPHDFIRFHFNQPIAPEAIQPALSIKQNGQSISHETRRCDDKKQTCIRIDFTKPLGRGSRIKFELKNGYSGMEGPLPAQNIVKGVFGDHPSLTVSASCNELGISDEGTSCWPMKNKIHEGLNIRFTTPITPRDFLRAVRIKRGQHAGYQKTKLEDWQYRNECNFTKKRLPCAKEFTYAHPLKKYSAYTIALRPGFTDIYGQRWKSEKKFTFQTKGLPPGIFLPRTDNDYLSNYDIQQENEDEYILEGRRKYTIKTINIKNLNISSAYLSGANLVHYLECVRTSPSRKNIDAWEMRNGKRHRKPCLLRKKLRSKIKNRHLKLHTRRDKVTSQRLKLLPPGKKGGLMAFLLQSPELKNPEKRPMRFFRAINFTNLNVHARLTPENMLIWVTKLRGAQPVPNARVQIRDRKGNLLYTGYTSIHGTLITPGYTLDPRYAKYAKHAGKIGSVPDATPSVSPSATGANGSVPADSTTNAGENLQFIPRFYVLVSKGTDETYCIPSTNDVEKVENAGYVFVPLGHSVSSRPASTCSLQTTSTKDFQSRPKSDYSEMSGAFWEGFGPHLLAYSATDRSIYRPGEPVYIYGLARKFHFGRHSPLAGQSVKIEVKTPSGAVLWSEKVKLDEYGAFSADLRLSSKAPLGRYRVRALRNGQALSYSYFSVKHYRPPRFTVSFMFKYNELVAGQIAEGTLQARFLSGGFVSAGGVRFVAKKSPVRRPFSVHPDYHIGPVIHSGPRATKTGVMVKGKKRLDSSGKTILKLNTPQNRYWHPVRIAVEAEVRDKTQSSVASRHSFLLHPSNYCVGIKRLGTTNGKWKRMRTKIKVFDTKAKPQSKRIVTVEAHPISQKKVSSVWHETPATLNVDWSKTLWKKELKISSKGKIFAFRYPMQHKRIIVVFSTTDEKGRKSRTDVVFYRPVKPRPNRFSPSKKNDKNDERDRRPSPLCLKLDKQSYDPGDTATITVQRKRPISSGMLFVEREKIHLAHPFRFGPRKKIRIRFPITEKHIGQLAVRAVAYPKARTRTPTGPRGPYRVSTAIHVSNQSLALSVDLKADKAVYRPGEKATIRFAVKDAAGKGHKSELFVMAIDESVLRLTHFAFTNPYDRLYFVPSEQVTFDETRHYLMPLQIPVVLYDTLHPDLGGYGLGGGGRGGGGSGAGSISFRGWGANFSDTDQTIRRDFRTTPFFRIVRTDEAGRGTVHFRLPDNITSFRLLALAFDKNRRAGVGRSSFRVNKPVLMIPALPRSARVGDRFNGGVVVYNNQKEPGIARVSVESKNLSFQRVNKQNNSVSTPQSTPPAHRSKRTISLRIPGKNSRTVRFPFVSTNTGTAHLLFRVNMGTATDALSHTLKINPVTVPQIRSVAGNTTHGAKQTIAKLTGVQSDYGGLQVSMSSTVLTGVEQGMEQLIKYPYGCLEQKSSQLLPLLAVISLGKRFGLKLPKNPRTMARRALSDILSMQLNDGGFSYWPGGKHAAPWMAAYVLIVLHRARLSGFAINPKNINRIVNYLRHTTKHPQRTFYWWPAQLSIISYALSLFNNDIYKSARVLFSVRKRLPLFSKAMLLAAVNRQIGASAIPQKVSITSKKTGRKNKIYTPKLNPKNKRKRAQLKKMALALKQELQKHLVVKGPHAAIAQPAGRAHLTRLMSSNVRTTAMTLMALLQTETKHPLVDKMASYLIGGRKNAAGKAISRFRNTQEAAWSLMALLQYARIRERSTPRFAASIWLGSKRLFAQQFQGRSLETKRHHVPMHLLLKAVGRASKQLIFHKKGAGRLYYTARLRYAENTLQRTRVNRGLEVQRRFFLLDGAGDKQKKQLRPQLGDVVQVELTVTNTETRRFVVVEDPLPAGLEAIDPSLATSSSWISQQKRYETGGLTRSSYNNRELRDDRVLHFIDELPPGKHRFVYLARVAVPGKYTWPPTRAEQMYVPEIYGLSAGRLFETE
jgi:uncharacterized protein YfaS (alpha-2-macroglobulin family)